MSVVAALVASAVVVTTVRDHNDTVARMGAIERAADAAVAKSDAARTAHPRPASPARELVSMPDLLGLKATPASDIVKSAAAAGRQTAPAISLIGTPFAGEPGRVVAQQPVVGKSMTDKVSFSVSSAAAIPDVRGGSITSATAALQKLGARPVLNRAEYDAALPVGAVIGTSPAAGAPLPLVVDLLVNAQPATVDLPDATTADDHNDCSSGSATVGTHQFPKALSCTEYAGTPDSPTRSTVLQYNLAKGVGKVTSTIGLSSDSTTARVHVVIQVDGKNAFDQPVSVGQTVPLNLTVTGNKTLVIVITRLDDDTSNSASLVLGGGQMVGAPDAVQGLGGTVPTTTAPPSTTPPTAPPTTTPSTSPPAEPNGLAPTTTNAISVVLVIDTSDSMNDTDGAGTIKIDGAKSAARTFIDSLPDTAELAIRNYPGPGGTSGGACSTGVPQLPLGPLSRDVAKQVVNGLTADGDTPTGPALQAAADQLPTSGPRAIVLISDGESNCGTPPCDVAKQLAASGLDLRVDTIGFQISDTGKQELQCIADSTKGSYYDAKDSKDLGDKLKQVSAADLKLTVTAPDKVQFGIAGPNPGVIEVTAHLANRGTTDAINAQVAIDFPTSTANIPNSRPAGDPVLVDNRRLLGNLRGGSVADVTWRIAVADPGNNGERLVLRYRVTLTGDGVTPTEQSNDIVISPFDGNRDQLDPILRGIHRPVIMGDSYSAGEGAGYYSANTQTPTNGCHRSAATYGYSNGRLVWDERTNIACSGDVIAAVWTANHGHDRHDPNNPSAPLPSQQDQLRSVIANAKPGHIPDAAVLTLGGNDIKFTDIIESCLVQSHCETRGWLESGRSNDDAVNDLLRGVEPNLLMAYAVINGELNSPAAVQARGHQAPIVVLAYPQPFPDDGGASLNNGAGGSCLLGFSVEEQKWAATVVQRLNARVHDAVIAARVRGVPITFVPETEAAFLSSGSPDTADHTLCGDHSWVNHIDPSHFKGLEEAILLGDWSRAASIVQNGYVEFCHPTNEGYQALTEVLMGSSLSPTHETGDFNFSPSNVAALPNPPPGAAAVRNVGSGDVSVAGGQWVTLQATGLPKGATAEARLASDLRVLGTGQTDSQGNARLTVWVPSNAPAGQHHVIVLARGSGPWQQKLSKASFSGREWQARWHWLVLGIAVAIVIVGLLWLRACRRRRKDRWRALIG